MQHSHTRTLVILSIAGAVALTGCGSSSKSKSGGLGAGTSAAGSAAAGATYKIGFQGPLSGTNQQLGINEIDGVMLAVNQANADPSLGFKIALLQSDSQGDPAMAPAAAAKIIQDAAVVGLIGPSFSGETKATGKTYGAAGIAMITPSATNPTLSMLGFPTFHRIVPSDNVEGTQGADWLARKGLKKVFVLDDLSDYGKGVADAVEAELKVKGVTVIRQGVDAKTTDYGATAQQITTSGATALFYGGYDAQAALLAKALKASGYTGLTVTGNGGKSSVFTKGAADAGDGWYFTCGCLDATTAPAAKAFTAAYTTAFKTPPSTYSPEAYDATNAMIAAIKAAKAAGGVTRASVETAVNALDYTGITTEVKFAPGGEVVATVQTVNLYEQKAGAIVLLGNIKTES